MERSQSYTSFETSGSSRSSSNRLKSNNFNQSRTNLSNNNNNNNNNINCSSYNNYKNKFALQMQQQRQQEQLQRQQWLLLYEQRRQQQQLLKQQQQFQQLQQAQSSDNLNAPLFLSSLNGLQLLHQKRRQKMLQRQKSTTSADELDFPLAHITTNDDHHHHDDDDDEDFDIEKSDMVTLREHLSIQQPQQQQHNNENYHHQNSNDDNDENQLTLTANSSSQLSGPMQQKFLRFQRQRPHSEAAINYRVSSPLATENQRLNQSQSAASSPTTSSLATTSSSASTTERRRLHHHDQCLSFDSAISSNTTANSAATTANMPSTANILASNADNMSPLSARHPHFGKLKRDNSLHSDSSRYSSVDSLLESRKPDPEAILINLGFGPVDSEDILSRIPKRFLKPSQLRGIDTEAFVRRLQLATSLADHSVLGYRGLVGNPDLPPSSIVAKIMQRFEVNERKKSMGSIEQTLR